MQFLSAHNNIKLTTVGTDKASCMKCLPLVLVWDVSYSIPTLQADICWWISSLMEEVMQ